MDVLRENYVVTKKAHFCTGCGRLFPSGTKMRMQVISDRPDFYNSYLCETCQIIWKRHPEIHEFYQDDFRDEALDYEKGLV